MRSGISDILQLQPLTLLCWPDEHVTAVQHKLSEAKCDAVTSHSLQALTTGDGNPSKVPVSLCGVKNAAAVHTYNPS